MLEVALHREADEEIREAARYYEERVENLGFDFFDEVEEAFERMKQFPRAWPVYEGEYRRCLLNRFPYGVIYRIDAEHIFVIAVAHLHRRPGYWSYRRYE